MGTVYEYGQSVVLSQIPNVIRWLQRKADEAGPNSVQVSGLDCKVASDLVAGLLAEVQRLQAENAEHLMGEAAIDELAFQRDINQQLGDENEQLRAQIAAMRPIVEAVAQHTALADQRSNRYLCMFCQAAADHLSDLEHTDTCMAEQARAYLAAHPAPESEA